MVKPQPTKPSTPRLSEVARHLILPSGIVSTGYPAVKQKCLELGVRFDPWQDGLGTAMLGKRADGKYAATVGGIVLSIPRQVGKTFTVGAIVFALCIIFPRLTVVWTAHRTRTAGETFRSMQGMARRQKIAPHVEQVFTGSGDEEIRFRNGSRILFGARERGFGRGFAEVDVEVFDEAQILTEKALDDMVPAANQSKHPAGALLFFIGTPPKPTDPGEAFTAKRRKALSGTSTDMLYLELSADPGAKPGDWAQVKKANPSHPHRTPREAILRMQENLTEESYIREALGVWDEEQKSGALSYSAWKDLADSDAERGSEVVFGIDVTEDRSAWIAVAWWRDDEHAQVMLANDGQALPAYRLVDECKRLASEWVGPVVAPKAFEDDLDEAGVEVITMTSVEFAAGSGQLIDAVNGGTVHHGNQSALNEAARTGKLRPPGQDGSRAFQLKDCPEVGPLAAATRALYGLGKYQSGFAIY